jgi:hypothetical protein
MGSAVLERYDDRIGGVLSCYDRVVITGTLPTVCCAAGMTKFLGANQVRIFDYLRFAEPLRELVRERAATLAAGADLSMRGVVLPDIMVHAEFREADTQQFQAATFFFSPEAEGMTPPPPSDAAGSEWTKHRYSSGVAARRVHDVDDLADARGWPFRASVRWSDLGLLWVRLRRRLSRGGCPLTLFDCRKLSGCDLPPQDR